MHKKLLKYFGSYRRNAVLAPLLTAGEVIMEILIPFITAMIIDRGIEGGSMRDLVFFGGLMLVCAFISLVCGVLAGKNAAKAFIKERMVYTQQDIIQKMASVRKNILKRFQKQKIGLLTQDMKNATV